MEIGHIYGSFRDPNQTATLIPTTQYQTGALRYITVSYKSAYTTNCTQAPDNYQEFDGRIKLNLTQKTTPESQVKESGNGIQGCELSY